MYFSSTWIVPRSKIYRNFWCRAEASNRQRGRHPPGIKLLPRASQVARYPQAVQLLSRVATARKTGWEQLAIYCGS